MGGGGLWAPAEPSEAIFSADVFTHLGNAEPHSCTSAGLGTLPGLGKFISAWNKECTSGHEVAVLLNKLCVWRVSAEAWLMPVTEQLTSRSTVPLSLPFSSLLAVGTEMYRSQPGGLLKY